MGFPMVNIDNILVSSKNRIIKEWEAFTDSEYRENLYNLYREIDNNLGDAGFIPELFGDFQNILEELSKVHTLALYTSNGRPAVEKVLKHHNIGQYFSEIRSWDDCDELNIQPKPSSEMLEIINKTFNFEKNMIYYIGDTSKDILFAKNSNINSIFANWGYGEIDNIMNPDIVIEEPNELLTIDI